MLALTLRGCGVEDFHTAQSHDGGKTTSGGTTSGGNQSAGSAPLLSYDFGVASTTVLQSETTPRVDLVLETAPANVHFLPGVGATTIAPSRFIADLAPIEQPLKAADVFTTILSFRTGSSVSVGDKDTALEISDGSGFETLRIMIRGGDSFAVRADDFAARVDFSGIIPESDYRAVVAWRAGGTIQVHVSGAGAPLESAIGAPFRTARTGERLLVFNDGSGNDPWLGTIRRLELYARALSAEEIAAKLAGP